MRSTRSFRQHRIIVGLLCALALCASATTASAADGTAVSSPHGRLLDVIDLPDNLTANATASAEQKAFSPDTEDGGSCAAAPERTEEGGQYGCLGVPVPDAKASTGKDTSGNDELSVEATCTTEVGVYTYDRFSSCLGNGQSPTRCTRS
nr:hypothetical protein OH837_38745 [Streptomyces canus]